MQIYKYYPSDKTTNISEAKLWTGRQLQLGVIPESQLIAWSSNSAPLATDKGSDPPCSQLQQSGNQALLLASEAR